jgi:hypothetical protein
MFVFMLAPDHAAINDPLDLIAIDPAALDQRRRHAFDRWPNVSNTASVRSTRRCSS